MVVMTDGTSVCEIGCSALPPNSMAILHTNKIQSVDCRRSGRVYAQVGARLAVGLGSACDRDHLGASSTPHMKSNCSDPDSTAGIGFPVGLYGSIAVALPVGLPFDPNDA